MRGRLTRSRESHRCHRSVGYARQTWENFTSTGSWIDLSMACTLAQKKKLQTVFLFNYWTHVGITESPANLALTFKAAKVKRGL